MVTIAEIEAGIAKSRRDGARRKADALTAWLELVVQLHDDRILPMTIDVARRAGVISDRVRGAGLDPGLGDVVIAATADVHGLILLTRNVRDFEHAGIMVHDPFTSLPTVLA